MTGIGVQLERLRSPNRDTRHDACEELRVAEDLPPQAFTPLELTAKNEDPLVVS